MLLLNGITGFFDKIDDPIKMVDGDQFKKDCYAISYLLNGKVICFLEPEFPSSFYKCEVELNNKQLYVLLNAHYPFVAFASVVDFGNIEFVDVQELAGVFSEQFQVLTNEDVNQPLRYGTKQNVLLNENQLNQSEIQQIAHWKPKTVGEVIYNQWD